MSEQPTPSSQPRKTRGPNKTKPKSLVSKLAEVQASIHGIEKTGYNDFQRYSYAEEAAIVEACRQELAERHIMIIPSIDAVQRDGDLTTIQTSYRIIDGETGQEIVTHWAGTGSDKQDKGLPKAATTSQKYLLLKLFLIPTGNNGVADDIENTKNNSADPPQPDMSAAIKRLEAVAQDAGLAGLKAEWSKPKWSAYRRWATTPAGQAAHQRTKDLAKAADKTKRAPVTDEILKPVGRDAFGYLVHSGDEE